ncbi:MAG: tetratricopeptide repeat protein [Deltaproteobacteria bacterium]
MKLKIPVLLLVLLLQWLAVSCTSTPWHREQADLYLKKGMSLIEAGQYIGALKELMEADKNAPNDPTINYYLGVAYHGRGLRDLAMERFQKAVDLKSDYSEAHNYIGAIYMDMGQWEKAVASFDRALKNYLYATPALALYNSGWAYYNLQNYDVALSRYQQALQQDRMGVLQAQIEKNIGLIYIKKSNLVQARQHLEKSVTLDPEIYDAHFFLGETYLKIRDTANARKSFTQVIKLAPQSPFAQKSREYLQLLP